MRTLLHLVTLVCLLWCTLGIAEPAAAHGHVPGTIETVASDSAMDADNHRDEAPDREQHQHCPIAPDLQLPVLSAPCVPVGAPPAAPVHAALTSLSNAPPLQPPAA
jgi:hypothetical protein